MNPQTPFLKCPDYKKNGRCKVLLQQLPRGTLNRKSISKELPELMRNPWAPEIIRTYRMIRKSLQGEKVVLYGHQKGLI
jgi:hypothetical protein